MRGICVGLVAMGFASAALGQNVVLSDGNSDAFFSLNAGNQVGWTVDGVDQLFNQRFFYRGNGFNDEVAVDSVPLTAFQATDTNAFDDNRADTLSVRYTDAGGLRFDIAYQLRGGSAGSGTADLAESIVIRNVGTVAQTVSFFQYVDFDLGGTAGGDIGRILNGRVAQQTDLAGGFNVSETVVTPAPNRFDVGNFPTIVSLFGNGEIDNLSNNPGPNAGDITWAFQWNFVLGAGDTFIISKDKRLDLVPAPAGVALVGLTGLVALGRRRR